MNTTMKLITQNGTCMDAITHWKNISSEEDFEKINAAVDQICKDNGFTADNVNAIIDALNNGDTSDTILFFNENVCVVLSLYKHTDEDWIWMLSLELNT